MFSIEDTPKRITLMGIFLWFIGELPCGSFVLRYIKRGKFSPLVKGAHGHVLQRFPADN